MNETTCRCGWKLPLSVFAVPLNKTPEKHNLVKRVYVSLICPQCERWHGFYNAEDPVAVEAAKRSINEQ